MTGSFIRITGKIKGDGKKYNICTIYFNENLFFLEEVLSFHEKKENG